MAVLAVDADNVSGGVDFKFIDAAGFACPGFHMTDTYTHCEMVSIS